MTSPSDNALSATPPSDNALSATSPSDSQLSADAAKQASANERAVGHKRDVPAQEVVTTATVIVPPPTPAVKTAPRRKVDFALLREQVTMTQVLEQLGWLGELRGRGLQKRGRCPIHTQTGDQRHTFSAHLGKGTFQCFHADCRAQGNVLDLWAAVHHLPLYEAALHLAQTFNLTGTEKRNP